MSIRNNKLFAGGLTLGLMVAGCLAFSTATGYALVGTGDPQPEQSQVVYSVSNKYLELWVGGNGAWRVDTVGGDPTVSTDDAVMGAGYGIWGVMCDVPAVYVYPSPWDWKWWKNPNAETIPIGYWGYNPLGGTLPYLIGGGNEYTIVGSYCPAFDTGEYTLPVICDLEAKLLRDTVRWKLTLTNEDIESRMLGFVARFEDAGSAAWASNGCQYSQATVLSAGDIPDVVETVDTSSIGKRHLFSEQGATTPDKVGIDGAGTFDLVFLDWRYGDNWVQPGINNWLYTPDPKVSAGANVLAAWKPKMVPHGGTYSIITYFGLNGSTSNFQIPNGDDPECVLAVQSPATLKYQYDASGTGSLNTSKITVSAYLTNLQTEKDDKDVVFTLVLPSGLTLDGTENGAYAKSVSTISSNCGEGSVSWVVDVDPAATGTLKYSVNVSGYRMNGGSVTREIYVPARPSVKMSSGWHMLSVPFGMQAVNTADASGLASNFWNYDLSGGGSNYPYAKAGCFTSGKAYWVKMNGATTVALQSSSDGPFYSAYDCFSEDQVPELALQQGWNMIGNPYVYDLPTANIKFYYQDEMIDMETAVTDGIVKSIVYWWDPVTGKYKSGSAGVTSLTPWQGYWIYVTKPGVLMHFGKAAKLGGAVGYVGSDTGGGETPGT